MVEQKEAQIRLFSDTKQKRFTKAASTKSVQRTTRVISHIQSHLARKQLYTHCLIQLLKSSSLPCHLREWRKRTIYLQQKRKYMYACMYVCVQSCLPISMGRIIGLHINSEERQLSRPPISLRMKPHS